MSSEIAWVAMLSCGHTIGSVPPPTREADLPIDSVTADRQRAAAGWGMAPQATAAKPLEPAFVPAPDAEQLVYCTECDEGRWVAGLVVNEDERLPQLDKRRAGTRW